MSTLQNESTTDTLYVETAGTICHIAGERGVVTALHYGGGPANEPTHAFVALDLRPAVLLVELGARVGGRRQWAEAVSAREITRDEFDQITGLARVRREMGWVR